MDERLRPLLDSGPAWLAAGGPDEDVVVAARVRLARNLATGPFPQQMDHDAAEGLVTAAREALDGEADGACALDPSDLPDADAEFLVERSVATRDLLHGGRPCLLWFVPDGLRGLMVNEEDHFRIQGFAAGAALEAAWQNARTVERRLRKRFRFAASEQYGYLTSCPSNVGSGLRGSLLLHLPAMARAKAPMQRTLQAARSASLEVRGVHGEGSRALGNLYQISNQRTLGTQAEDQLRAVVDFGREVAAYERATRKRMGEDPGARRELTDEVRRAATLLRDAAGMATSEALDVLSKLRLGALCGVAEEAEAPVDERLLLQLCFRLQPGHLQAHLGRVMAPAERDTVRVASIREALGVRPDEGGAG